MSDALAELTANLGDVDQLLDMCRQPRPGRPMAANPIPIEAVSRSCLVLTVAFWENYVEQVVRESVEFLGRHPRHFTARSWFDDKLKYFNVPNSTNVEVLLGSFLGLTTPVRSMTWRGMTNPADRLDKLLKRRHKIAHTGRAASRVWKLVVTNDRTFVESLARTLDERIAQHVLGLCGTRPW